MPDLWVFGYGSLMWRPGFEFEECVPARLYGYHRSFCVYSHVHRGTPERPGLVFGLDAGGSCRGLAYRVAGTRAAATRRYLQAREQVTLIYREVMVPVTFIPDNGIPDNGIPANGIPDNGGRNRAGVEALTFVVDRRHPQYAGKLPFEIQARLIADGVGRSGRNPDYLAETVRHLSERGVGDKGLIRLWHAVERMRSQASRRR